MFAARRSAGEGLHLGRHGRQLGFFGGHDPALRHGVESPRGGAETASKQNANPPYTGTPAPYEIRFQPVDGDLYRSGPRQPYGAGAGPSLPVQAVQKGYKLSRAASAFVGLLYALAEYATEESLIRMILRAVFRDAN